MFDWILNTPLVPIYEITNINEKQWNIKGDLKHPNFH